MKFVILFGQLAVGKMTVGQELEKITSLKLFHNHMTIELVLPFFDRKSKTFRKLVDSVRIQMFKEIAKSNLEGVIFTYVWELDQKTDDDFVHKVVNIFKNASIYYVELEADVKERLKRNKSPNRLKHKPSKKNFKASIEELLETDRKHTVNSKAGEFQSENYLKINNTKVSAKKAAKMIKSLIYQNEKE